MPLTEKTRSLLKEKVLQEVGFLRELRQMQDESPDEETEIIIACTLNKISYLMECFVRDKLLMAGDWRTK